MKLFITETSPYARKVRIAIRELGLDGAIEEVLARTRHPDNEILRHGPVGKVPALLTDDGRLLTESQIICIYLDDLHDGPKLIPAPGEERTLVLEIDGIATGLLDGIAFRSRELRFRDEGERSPSLFDYESERCRRCFDALENLAGQLTDRVRLAEISLATALLASDSSEAILKDDWRQDRPALAAWFDAFRSRPSIRATLPPEA
ncbi:MAG: glutathione S-transferase family protein [Alphaproteobacteria bacterium]|jgi:glutathione S-transferase|nr:glutathione S-transferase family protein [Alphaproteobacteria bacterium]